jgi:SAM-dependent methyltransferase
MTQRWKSDESLHSCPTKKNGAQIKKVLDYENVYIEEFLNQDEIRDWESIDRCKDLWYWALELAEIEDISKWTVLDCGTKDGQFPEYLIDKVDGVIGTEVSQPYIDYARERERPVIYDDVCDIDFEDNSFDLVFSHHLLGLTSDYMKALEEMYRVTKPGGYMITLNNVPGNPKKHYSYIDSPLIYFDFIEKHPCKVLYNKYIDNEYKNEWVLFIQKEDKK